MINNSSDNSGYMEEARLEANHQRIKSLKMEIHNDDPMKVEKTNAKKKNIAPIPIRLKRITTLTSDSSSL